ncbi:MAG: TolC family protein [Steroidobacteraceae bacterium]
MHRYRSIARCLVGCATALAVTGCSLPSSRTNVDAAAQLVATQTRAALEWRRDPEADQAARRRAEALLEGGLTLDEAIGVAFLASPELQLSLEQLEISRAQLVAAVTPPNPVAIIGTRKPGGDLAAFYPDRSVSIGVLQNVMALLNIADRSAIARHDLQRVRFETAQHATAHAAQVAQAWLEYSAAMQIQALRQRSLAAAKAAFDTVVVRAANGSVTSLQVAVERNSVFAVESSAIRSELDVATARARLGGLLGVTGWHDDWRIEAVLPPLPASDPDLTALELQAMEQRLDLQAAAKTVDARLRVLAMQRRFRWLNQLEIGVFRDRAIGGTDFTGPNAVVELPLFDQRQAALLGADSELRSGLRGLEAARMTARNEIRLHAAEMHTTRRLLEQFERDIKPNQQQIAAGLGSADPGEPERLRLSMSMLSAEEDYTGLLRDYWRARSALALAAGDWAALRGL